MAATSKADKTIPNLENATTGYLIDEIARMRAESARLKFLDGVYKEAIKARATPDQLEKEEPFDGENSYGWFETRVQERIDSDAVREMFADQPEVLKKLIKVISFQQLTTKPKPFPNTPLERANKENT